MVNPMSYTRSTFSRKLIPILAVFVILFCFLTVYHQSEALLPYTSYFDLHTSPKDEFLLELEKNPNYTDKGFNFQPSNPAKLPCNTKVLHQLKKLFPYDPTLPIPKTIWQMWKVGLEHKEFPPDYKKYVQTWEDLNPEYEHLVKTNAECDAMVAKLYADVPDIIHAYNIMPETILKCDFSRYLILFAHGGVYADMDTHLLKPIRHWISHEPSFLDKPLNLGLVVGIESDREDWQTHCARRVQVNTWTIMARKGHPMLAELINTITQETLHREESGLLTYMLGRDAGDNVINWTGPGLFTDVTFRYMNSILQPDFENYENLINYKFFINVTLPVTIGDVMVLPEECMHPRNKSKEGKYVDPMAYVHHLGLGVWKEDKMKLENPTSKPKSKENTKAKDKAKES
ncbi:Initiation-specific alpha-16-mannosyltransferase [Spathaspora sp. JA1]|nr:Initiation-specific alpha-16-mannosyltransferase [Spathaspora sp. JA1]